MSTEFKHTPGPWEVYYPDITGCGLGIDTADSKTSIVVFDDEAGVYGAGEQDEANARLIAAAPELLEALQIAHQYMQVFMIRGEEPLVGENLKTDLYKVLEAIKKATGQ
jgi:hypothetical protein